MANVEDYMILTSALKKVNLERIVRTVAEQHKVDIADLNREQLDRGEYASNRRLPMPYAPATIARKVAKRQPIDRITLEDTGSFKSKIKPKFYKSYFELDSSDRKSDTLKKEWGQDIFGLQKRSMEELVSSMRVDVSRLVRESLFSSK